MPPRFSCDAGGRTRRSERVADAAADRVRHRHMRDAALSEKAFLSREGSVDELVDDDEIAGLELLAQAADRRQGHDVGHAAALQRVDIGAEIYLGGRQYVPAAVPRDEHDRLAVECAEAEFVGSRAERALNAAPLDIRKAVDLIEARCRR